MADPRYSIGPVAPDITPGLAMLTAAFNANRQHARADEYVQMQREAMASSAERESHEAKRREEADKYKRSVEAFNAMPMLQRAAMRSVGLANTNPYGVRFEETRDLPANVEGPQASPEAEAARFAPKPTAPAATPIEPPRELDYSRPRMPSPSAEMRGTPATHPQMAPSGYVPGTGMEGFGEEERQRAASNLDLVGQGLAGPPRAETDLIPETPEDQIPLMMQAASNSFEPGPEGKRRLFASYQGNRFEVPEQKDTTGLGPEYDALYQRMLENLPPGASPQHAFEKVLADYQKDQAEKGRDTRLGKMLGFRETNREDTQRFTSEENKKYKETHEGRLELIDRAGKYKVAASAPTLKIDTANRQDMGALRQGFKEWKNTVNLAIDSKSHKRLATAMANLDSGNAMQEREAAESLVAIFKGGGQVTKASQDLLLKHLAGIVGDVQTWLQHVATGNFGSMELNVLKQATRNALKEEQEKLHGYYESAADTFGPGSGYEQLGGNVNAMVKGAFKQFGYDAPSVYPETAEPVVLGSGQRPKAPTSKPPAKTVTIRNKKTGETKEVSLEEARRMGAAP